MIHAAAAIDMLLEHGVCFVTYDEYSDTVRRFFDTVHEGLGNQITAYRYASVPDSILERFLSRLAETHRLEISRVRPLGRRLLALQGQIDQRVLLSLENSRRQEGDIASILSDCIDSHQYRRGWFHLLVGLTPASLHKLATQDPRLHRRYFMTNELFLSVEE